MALHITDPKAERAVRELAKRRGLSLTRAVEVAAEEALKRHSSTNAEQMTAIRSIQERLAALPRRRDAFASHKEFFDWINEDK